MQRSFLLKAGKINVHVYQSEKPSNFVFGDVKLSKSKAVPAVNSRISNLWFCIFSVTGRGALRGPVLCWSSDFMISRAGISFTRAPSMVRPLPPRRSRASPSAGPGPALPGPAPAQPNARPAPPGTSAGIWELSSASDTWWSRFASARARKAPAANGGTAAGPPWPLSSFHGPSPSGRCHLWIKRGLLFYPDHHGAVDSVEGPDDLWKVKIS